MKQLRALVLYLSDKRDLLPAYRQELARVSLRIKHLKEQHGMGESPQFRWGGPPEGEIDLDWRLFDFERSQGLLEVHTTSWGSDPPGRDPIRIGLRKTGFVEVQGHLSDLGLTWAQSTVPEGPSRHRGPGPRSRPVFKMTPGQVFDMFNFFYQKWHEVLGVPKEEES